MTSTNSIDQFKQIQKEGLELFSKKNKDYGDVFNKYGTVGVIIRIGDKIDRLMSIEKNRVILINDESIRDTLIDLHNYAAMALMTIDNEKEKERENAENSGSNNNQEQCLLDYIV